MPSRNSFVDPRFLDRIEKKRRAQGTLQVSVSDEATTKFRSISRKDARPQRFCHFDRTGEILLRFLALFGMTVFDVTWRLGVFAG